jgi:hypothetical protein
MGAYARLNDFHRGLQAGLEQVAESGRKLRSGAKSEYQAKTAT